MQKPFKEQNMTHVDMKCHKPTTIFYQRPEAKYTLLPLHSVACHPIISAQDM